jgi:hypothetical protein
MTVIFRFLGKAYNYKIVDGEVQNYVIYDDPYQGLCETDEEKAEFDTLFLDKKHST